MWGTSPSLNTTKMKNAERAFLESQIGKTAFSSTDKKKIATMARNAGLRHSFNTGCADCYRDAVIMLCLHYGVRKAAVANPTPGKYVYLREKPFTAFFGGRMVTMGADSPDAIIEEFHRAIGGQFPQFYKMKEK